MSLNNVVSNKNEFPLYKQAFNSTLTLSEAYDLISSVGEKHPQKPDGCIKPSELKNLLKFSSEKQVEIRAYDGFEPSGRMHIAQGLLKAVNVNKLTKCGVKFTFLVADWFAQLNNKMGGDLTKIREVGNYFIEIWRACGMDLSRVEFLWSSEEINKRPDEYWTIVMDMARKNSVSRIKRCGQIMGRIEAKEDKTNQRKELLKEIFKNKDLDSNLNEDEFIDKYSRTTEKYNIDSQPVAQLLYPLMQCTDIFFLKANICQLGMDQLKVNVLAREYCDSFHKKDTKNRKKFRKPVILSHHMLMGLKEGQEKMSKSDPDSAIFMEDSVKDVNRKIKQAFCRPGDIETNPILDYLEHIIFPCLKQKCSGNKNVSFCVERDLTNGGDIFYSTYEDIKNDFKNETLHPKDLKLSVSREINALLQPVRDHFIKGQAKDLLDKIKRFKITKS